MTSVTVGNEFYRQFNAIMLHVVGRIQSPEESPITHDGGSAGTGKCFAQHILRKSHQGDDWHTGAKVVDNSPTLLFGDETHPPPKFLDIFRKSGLARDPAKYPQGDNICHVKLPQQQQVHPFEGERNSLLSLRKMSRSNPEIENSEARQSVRLFLRRRGIPPLGEGQGACPDPQDVRRLLKPYGSQPPIMVDGVERVNPAWSPTITRCRHRSNTVLPPGRLRDERPTAGTVESLVSGTGTRGSASGPGGRGGDNTGTRSMSTRPDGPWLPSVPPP